MLAVPSDAPSVLGMSYTSGSCTSDVGSSEAEDSSGTTTSRSELGGDGYVTHAPN
jgi:hypothetical protein